MLEKALDKIEAEMMKNSDNHMMVSINDYLVEICKKSPVAAEKIANSEKTMKGAIAHLTAYAKKKAVSGCAVIKDDEAFNVICDYYKISDIEEKPKEPEPQKVVSIFDMM